MKSLLLILFALFSLWTIVCMGEIEREKTNKIYNTTTDDKFSDMVS